jgi:hypothetical protein
MSHALQEVTVQLLDAATGRPVQTWRFQAKDLVSIGRAEDRDVVLSDPTVSRNHAELQWSNHRWTLFSRGRNGVVVENQVIAEHPVNNGSVTFRLGTSGPTLRFLSTASGGTGDTESPYTICFDSTEVLPFTLDRKRLSQEVESIAENPYFKTLQDAARKMRQRRTP